MKLNYDELLQKTKYNKNGKPNKHSQIKQENIEKAIAVLKKCDEDPSLFFHHRAVVSGQLSRTQGCIEKPYNGVYGTGVTVDVPNYGEGSKFYKRYYFIKKGDDKDASTTKT